MKRIKNILITAACGLAMVHYASGQDLHFSQFFNSPLTTNPANTGFIPEGDYRLGVNYRNQWSSIMSLPYKTMSAFGDFQLMKPGEEQSEKGWLGLGAVILRDVAGSGNLTSTKIYGSIAYHQPIGFSSLLSLGFNAGWVNKQINITNLKFPDQFDGKFFDNKLPTSAVLSANNISYFDMQVGMNYALFPTDDIYVNGGYSMHHVNKPRESFFNNLSDSNRVPRRHTAFLNGVFKLNNQWLINPNAYFTMQANTWQLNLGANAHYNLSGDGEQQLLAGLYFRSKDAIIPLIGLAYKDLTFTFTYDATISTLRNYNNTRGAFEFSLIKQGLFDQFTGNKRDFKCPSLRQY
jgi:type IX secretion system PorP/SprF family membrane protein